MEVGAINGVDDLNDYSSDQFSINKCVSYFMDRAAIMTNTRAAVECLHDRGGNFDMWPTA